MQLSCHCLNVFLGSQRSELVSRVLGYCCVIKFHELHCADKLMFYGKKGPANACLDTGCNEPSKRCTYRKLISGMSRRVSHHSKHIFLGSSSLVLSCFRLAFLFLSWFICFVGKLLSLYISVVLACSRIWDSKLHFLKYKILKLIAILKQIPRTIITLPS